MAPLPEGTLRRRNEKTRTALITNHWLEAADGWHQMASNGRRWRLVIVRPRCGRSGPDCQRPLRAGLPAPADPPVTPAGRPSGAAGISDVTIERPTIDRAFIDVRRVAGAVTAHSHVTSRHRSVANGNTARPGDRSHCASGSDIRPLLGIPPLAVNCTGHSAILDV